LVLHGHSPIPTHQRGKKAINGIYLSQALLEDARGGILALRLVTPSDHQAVRIDIKATLVAMCSMTQLFDKLVNDWNIMTPILSNSTTNLWWLAGVIDLQVEVGAAALHQLAKEGHWTALQEIEYNALDQQLTKAKLVMETKCQKISTDRTLWMLALTQAIQQILYWKGVCKWIQKGKISMTVLKQRALKGQEKFSKSHWQLSLEQVQRKVTMVYEDFHQIKAQKTLETSGSVKR